MTAAHCPVDMLAYILNWFKTQCCGVQDTFDWQEPGWIVRLLAAKENSTTAKFLSGFQSAEYRRAVCMSMVTVRGSIILDSYLLKSITWRLPPTCCYQTRLASEYFVIQYRMCLHLYVLRNNDIDNNCLSYGIYSGNSEKWLIKDTTNKFTFIFLYF